MHLPEALQWHENMSNSMIKTIKAWLVVVKIFKEHFTFADREIQFVTAEIFENLSLYTISFVQCG